jgi:hypothetical protein
VVVATPRTVGERLDYMPLEYADLLALSETLAAESLGHATSSSEGNLSRTLFELSSLVGHVLAVYQDRYAGEAFLRTANAPSSLVRHARRLAHAPDVGLSATGFVALIAKSGLSGTIAPGLELASTRKGDVPPQSFETLAELSVDAALNELRPAEASLSIRLRHDVGSMTLAGVGLGLAAGDLLCIVGELPWQARTATDIQEDRTTRTTTVTLDDPLAFTGATSSFPAAAARVLVDPAIKAYSFGWNADPTLYPQTQLRSATGDEATTGSSPRYWYRVDIIDQGTARGVRNEDHYLARLIEEPLLDSYVVHVGGGERRVSKVSRQLAGPVTLMRKTSELLPTFTVKVTPDGGGGFTTTTTPAVPPVTQESVVHLSATVSALELRDRDQVLRQRTAQQLPASWLGGFRRELLAAGERPNPTLLQGSSLMLAGSFPQLAPGRYVVFSNLAGTRAQVVRLGRVQLESGDRTQIWWQALDAAPAQGFQLGDLKVFANVAPVIHGRTVHEIAGDSDGVTPFQRFALRKWPLSMRASSDGAAPEIELRVNEVGWQRVADFFASKPEDRHYRVEFDEQQRVSVLFGDGVRGAIPPAGARNIAVDYKIGLGPDGNAAPLEVARIKSPQALLERAFNPLPISGGREAAAEEDVRSQATRYIRTFDRAVSVSDHADLALLFPGVVRSAARWDEASQTIVLVAASAGGAAPAPELRSFLDQRRDTQVPLQLETPSPRALILELLVEIDPAFLFENVRLGIHAALLGGDPPGLFTFEGRALGQPAYASEVQATIEEVPGVIGAQITRFSAISGTGVYDAVQARVSQWLSLSSQALSIQRAGGAA